LRNFFLLLLLLAVLRANAQLVAETHSFNGLNQTIPDGDAAGLSDVRTVTSAVANLTGVRVKLQVAGEFNGDLYGYVRHTGVDFTNFCVLLNRVGRTAGTQAGCVNTGFDVVFDDDAAQGDIHTCNLVANPPAGTPLAGDWQPDGRNVDPAMVSDLTARTTALSSFNGVNPSGRWTLFLADLEAGGTNQLLSWELEFFSRATVSGTVRYYPATYPPTSPSAKTVADTQIMLNGDTNLSTLTLSDGRFAFAGVAGGGTYELIPSEANDSAPTNGVSTLDIALIRQHILSPGSSTLTTPYKLLAADVNGSASVTTLDIALIRQVILGSTDPFPAGRWRFVPADHVFPDANAPWSAPSESWHANLINDLGGLDFVAIKLGDVDDSWTMPVGQTSGTRSGDGIKATLVVRFETGQHVVQQGESVKIPITVSGFREVTSAQFTLSWDPAVLRYAGAGDYGLSSLSAGNLSSARSSEGKLMFSWNAAAATGVTVADGSAIFRVSFEATGKPGSVSALRLMDSPTPREASVGLALATLATEEGVVQVIELDELRLSNAVYREGEFRLTVKTESGRRYILEFTDRLPALNWTALPAVKGNGEELVLTDPAATNHQRFYRVRIE
jgi:subtilisin-like proprotein convertase family protein